MMVSIAEEKNSKRAYCLTKNAAFTVYTIKRVGYSIHELLLTIIDLTCVRMFCTRLF